MKNNNQIGQELSEFKPVEIVGYEVCEAGSPCHFRGWVVHYMFVRWNSDNKRRHLNSYLTFCCPLARLCGRGQKVEL